MNLLSTVMVEPKDAIRTGARAGGQFFSAIGGLPRGESVGPWSTADMEIVQQAVTAWHRQAPEGVTHDHGLQRNQALTMARQGNFQFVFSFNTGDDIDLDCFHEDTGALYDMLRRACGQSDLVVSQFESV